MPIVLRGDAEYKDMKTTEIFPFLDHVSRIGTILYISVNGEICTKCDLDYDSIEEESIGNTSDMDQFIKEMEKRAIS